MIAPSRPDVPPVSAVGTNTKRPISLPTYGRLVSASCWVCAPIIAFLLLGGRMWLALSVIIGLVLSVTVCGLLYLFVARGMDYFVAGVRGGPQEKNGSVGQFMLLLPAKFLIVGLLGWALLTLHSINYIAVLVGFGLAQTAIAVTAARHFTKR
jgi:hypothetical protein